MNKFEERLQIYTSQAVGKPHSFLDELFHSMHCPEWYDLHGNIGTGDRGCRVQTYVINDELIKAVEYSDPEHFMWVAAFTIDSEGLINGFKTYKFDDVSPVEYHLRNSN